MSEATRSRSEIEPEPGGDPSGDQGRVERAVRDLRSGIDVEGSFRFLFRRFSPALERQLIRWGAAPEEARDLNQEIFQGIFRDVDRFRGEERLFASWVGWIWKIARTTWLRSERAKRAQKRPHDPQSLDGLIEERQIMVERPPSQLDGVLVQELEGRVRVAVGELPDQERNCVILHYYQGLKVREIAVILRIAPGTVKAHLSHARAKLKSNLGGWIELADEPGRAGDKPGDARV